jgi:2-polyprenyl-6-methoxyphenol hydroxylase-like FAD-dependent oxidoreductase
MDVAVVGGGIGGLSLALQLERAGIDCRVYESVPAYAPLGVGINLFPLAVRRRHALLVSIHRRAPFRRVFLGDV